MDNDVKNWTFTTYLSRDEYSKFVTKIKKNGYNYKGFFRNVILDYIRDCE